MAADDEHAHVKYTVNQIGCVTFAHPCTSHKIWNICTIRGKESINFNGTTNTMKQETYFTKLVNCVACGNVAQLPTLSCFLSIQMERIQQIA